MTTCSGRPAPPVLCPGGLTQVASGLPARILEGERETHLHRIAFRTLTEAALSPEDSKQRILDIAEDYWTGTRR